MSQSSCGQPGSSRRWHLPSTPYQRFPAAQTDTCHHTAHEVSPGVPRTGDLSVPVLLHTLEPRQYSLRSLPCLHDTLAFKVPSISLWPILETGKRVPTHSSDLRTRTQNWSSFRWITTSRLDRLVWPTGGGSPLCRLSLTIPYHFFPTSRSGMMSLALIGVEPRACALNQSACRDSLSAWAVVFRLPPVILPDKANQHQTNSQLW